MSDDSTQAYLFSGLVQQTFAINTVINTNINSFAIKPVIGWSE